MHAKFCVQQYRVPQRVASHAQRFQIIQRDVYSPGLHLRQRLNHRQEPCHWFFICVTPGHCQAGQKVDIKAVSLPVRVHANQLLGIPTVLVAPAKATNLASGSSSPSLKNSSCSRVDCAFDYYY